MWISKLLRICYFKVNFENTYMNFYQIVNVKENMIILTFEKHVHFVENCEYWEKYLTSDIWEICECWSKSGCCYFLEICEFWKISEFENCEFWNKYVKLLKKVNFASFKKFEETCDLFKKLWILDVNFYHVPWNQG